MGLHNQCETNCGGTACQAPSKRIEEARQAQPEEELERKAKKSARRGLWTQEQIDWILVAGKKLAAKLQRRVE